MTLRVTAILALAGLLAAQTGDLAVETIQLDAHAASKPFPHYWEQVFGSGRANLSLRESFRRDLHRMKEATGIRYVRFHGIFDDENGVYDVDAQGHPVYNFSYIDQIYDGLLDAGVRPFVEMSFMPSRLAASQTPHAFWYKPLPNPPKDYNRWGDLIGAFGRHLVERYGIDEVSQWYFEVWNEPNIDFWTGTPKEQTYYQLYDAAARALRKVDPKLRVGGPATAQAAWVDRLIDHCVRENVPLDFVSAHVYGNDSAQDVFGTSESISRRDMVARAVRKVYDQVKSSKRPNLPIHWTEYNATYMNEPEVTDAPFMGPWLANNIRMCDSLTTTMSYWTFTDVFEEQGVVKKPYYGGYGLIAAGGIPKPAFNAFALLHRLGEQRIDVRSENVIATKTTDGRLVIALWNYAEPAAAGRTFGQPKKFQLDVTGIPKSARVRTWVVDATHGNAVAAWQTLGQPASPTRDVLEELRQAARLPAPVDTTAKGPISVSLSPYALAILEIQP